MSNRRVWDGMPGRKFWREWTITGSKAEVDKVEPTKGNGIGVLVIGRGNTESGTRDRIQ